MTRTAKLGGRVAAGCLLAALGLGLVGLAGCTVTAAAPPVSVRWWYYPHHDIYFRDGVWWYYGVEGWVRVELLPSWIVLAPDAVRVRVDLPRRAVPHRRWPEHRPHRRRTRPAPRTWRRPHPRPRHRGRRR